MRPLRLSVIALAACLVTGAAPPSAVHPDVGEAGEWAARNRHYLHSMLVQQCDALIAEHYYGLYTENQRHDLQSATKTITSTLVGVALQNGRIASLDTPLRDLLPKYKRLLTGRKAAITLRHLLTMSSGLRWVDFGPRNSFERMAEADDSVAFILGEPLVGEPGKTWAYNSGSSHLLSAVVEAATGMTSREYAERELFAPLGITSYEWRVHPDGTTEGGWQLYLRPRDMIKIGELYLARGMADDRRLLAGAFADAAMTSHFDTGRGVGYGFQMWIDPTLGAPRTAAARGWGGQAIWVIPDARAVVVFTGDIHHDPETREDLPMLMRRFIIPALMDRKDSCGNAPPAEANGQ